MGTLEIMKGAWTQQRRLFSTEHEWPEIGRPRQTCRISCEIIKRPSLRDKHIGLSFSKNTTKILQGRPHPPTQTFRLQSRLRLYHNHKGCTHLLYCWLFKRPISQNHAHSSFDPPRKAAFAFPVVVFSCL